MPLPIKPTTGSLSMDQQQRADALYFVTALWAGRSAPVAILERVARWVCTGQRQAPPDDD